MAVIPLSDLAYQQSARCWASSGGALIGLGADLRQQPGMSSSQAAVFLPSTTRFS